MYRLHTSAAEVAQALLVVMRRGSLRAAEEITGHTYETIGAWLRRASMRSWELTARVNPTIRTNGWFFLPLLLISVILQQK